MSYRTAITNCRVQIVHLRHLNQSQMDLCESLRREAGRCWTTILDAQVRSRSDQEWFWQKELKEIARNGSFKLHTHSVQMLCEKLESNVKTGLALIRQEKELGRVTTQLPHQPKDFFNVTWKFQDSKSSAVRKDGRLLRLSNGRETPSLVITLPSECEKMDVHNVELGWLDDHYVLYLTVDTGVINPPMSQGKRVAGVDMGEVNIAAVVTQDGNGIVISGRHLRSVKRLRNKRHSDLDRLLQRCTNGSKRHKKLTASKKRATGRLTNQQRDVLHKAAKQVVDFCEKERIAVIGIGDVRDVADGVDHGRKNNQKISQWPHGQFGGYVREKARVFGINCKHVDESYSTKTCSVCGAVRTSSPKGRNFLCPNRGVERDSELDRDVPSAPTCGAELDRDGNGAVNICSRTKFGEYGRVQLARVSHVFPLRIGSDKVSAKRPSGRVSSDKVSARTVGPSSRATDIGRERVPVACGEFS